MALEAWHSQGYNTSVLHGTGQARPSSQHSKPKIDLQSSQVEQTLSRGWRMPDPGADALCSTAPISEQCRGAGPWQNLPHRSIPFPLTPTSPVQAPSDPVTQAPAPGAAQRALLSSCVCSGRLILGAQLMTCAWPGEPGDWC